jgi:hypothetical protein
LKCSAVAGSSAAKIRQIYFMEVMRDLAFWRTFERAHDAKAEKNGGAEYRVERTDSGYAVSGPALSKPSFFKDETKAMSLARHCVGPAGGSIVRIAGNGKTSRQRVPAKLAYTPTGGHQRDAELEEYDGNFPFPVPAESRQALQEWIRKRDQEVVRRATDALLKAGYHR